MLDWAEAAMARAELYQFLMAEPRFAALASLRRTGAPFVVPVGFVYDGAALFFSIPDTRGGAHRLRRDARASVTVFSPNRPTRFFIAQGVVEEISDPGNEMSQQVLDRYADDTARSVTYRDSYFNMVKVVFRLQVDEYASSDLTKVDPTNPRYAQTPAEWNRAQLASVPSEADRS